MAEKHDAEVEILIVVDEIKTAPDWMREYSEKLKEQGEEILTKTFNKATKQKPNIKISNCLAEGYASEEILKCAKKRHHEAIGNDEEITEELKGLIDQILPMFEEMLE